MLVSWEPLTEAKAARLRHTVQPKVLVELGATALALIVARRIARLGPLDVTAYGDRADFRSASQACLLEISGTENVEQLRRRHKQKVTQALANPFGWDAYVVVCAFSSIGHQLILSRHSAQE